LRRGLSFVAFGLVYFIVAYASIPLATGSAAQVRGWRLAAWAVCAVNFAAHIAFEQRRLRSAPAQTALYVAAAVAIGAFGLALAALVRAVVTGTGQPALLAIAMLAWPLVTAVPAYLVAFAAAVVMTRIPDRRSP
jgi:hypothetical protein